MKRQINRFKDEESGQGVVEYAMILAGIAFVLVIAIFALGQQVSDFFISFGDKIAHPNR